MYLKISLKKIVKSININLYNFNEWNYILKVNLKAIEINFFHKLFKSKLYFHNNCCESLNHRANNIFYNNSKIFIIKFKKLLNYHKYEIRIPMK